jgi:hypothetical protein
VKKIEVLIAAALIAVILLSSSSCKTGKPPVDASPIPTATAQAIAPQVSESPLPAITENPVDSTAYVSVAPTVQPGPERVFGEIASSIPIGSGADELLFRDRIVDDMTNWPEDFAMCGNGFYVLNSAANNVLRFSENGEFISGFQFAQSTDYYHYGEKFAVANSRMFIVAEPEMAPCKLYVLDLETGNRLSEIDLPKERGTVDPKDPFDNGDWYGGEGFAGSIMLMYEADNRLVFVVHESYRCISSFVYDYDAASVERTNEYGFSGTVTGRNQTSLVLHNNETGFDVSFSLGDWTFIRLLGLDNNGNFIVEAFNSGVDYQPVPRKVLKIGPEGIIISESSAIEDLGFIRFSLGDDSNVYAMIRDGDHVNFVRVNLY